MAWFYVGLVATGVSQLANGLLRWSPWLAVVVPSVLVVLAGAVAVHSFTPRALRPFDGRGEAGSRS